MASKTLSGNGVFNVNEIFFSVQGEGSRAGMPCVFVRLQGCSLRCSWCDTAYALDNREEAKMMSKEELKQTVLDFDCDFIEFTGGEPLEHEGVAELMSELCDLGKEIAVETGGHVDASSLDPRIIRIIDIKCPGSNMHTLMKDVNLQPRKGDEYKFVVADKQDFDFAVDIVRKYSLLEAASVLISPVFGTNYQQVVEWILATGLPLRLQLQMHKYIWDPETRGV